MKGPKDESPISEFVARMIDAHKRRLKALNAEESGAIEREMEGFMRQYFTRSANDAMAAAEAAVRQGAGDVEADECESSVVDRKTAAAGNDGE